MVTGKYVAPDLKKQAFSCPHCGAYTSFVWKTCFEQYPNHPPYKYIQNSLNIANCFNCKEKVVWYEDDFHSALLWPIGADTAPLPHEDMPDVSKEDFLEARKLFRLSPRSAAALLRLSFEKLLVALECEGSDSDASVELLVEKGLPNDLKQALVFVRAIGENRVPAGELSAEDKVETVNSFFQILNLIVDCMITQRRRIQALYDSASTLQVESS